MGLMACMEFIGAVVICVYGVEESDTLTTQLNEVFLDLVYNWDIDPRKSWVLRQIMEYVSILRYLSYFTQFYTMFLFRQYFFLLSVYNWSNETSHIWRFLKLLKKTLYSGSTFFKTCKTRPGIFQWTRSIAILAVLDKHSFAHLFPLQHLGSES